MRKIEIEEREEREEAKQTPSDYYKHLQQDQQRYQILEEWKRETRSEMGGIFGQKEI